MNEPVVDTRTQLETGAYDAVLTELYGHERLEAARKRYTRACDAFGEHFGEGAPAAPLRLFSTPGRTELAGNHTDHNNGKVLAGAVHMDAIAVVRAREDARARVRSAGYEELAEVDLADLVPRDDERGTPQALLRGVAAGIAERGGALAGFDAYVDSEVLPGSGLSSSAAFEVLLAQIMNAVANRGALDGVALAKIGQYAENAFFGKPCGLMDQLACAVGGVLAIDFHPDTAGGDGGWPRIDRVPFRFAEHGLRLFVIDTGGSHADLTEDYAAVRREMNQVAEFFGAETLGELGRAQLDANLAALRRALGDRAVLRATHFFDDTERVDALFRALQSGETGRYLALVQESGLSSLVLLQNCYSTRHPDEQGIPLAVSLTRRFLSRSDAGRAADAQPFGRTEFDIASSPGACRVQGGGFAGTVQAYVTEERAAAYRTAMESVFGAGSVTEIQIRSRGALELVAAQRGPAQRGTG